MPEKAIGMSASKYANDPFLRPRCTPLGSFIGNTAHRYTFHAIDFHSFSAVESGIMIDKLINQDGSVGNSGMWNPSQGPFDPNDSCFGSSVLVNSH